MDCDTAGYKLARYEEVSNEVKSMLVKVGWKKDMAEKNVPFLPISGWMGDNLLKQEDSTGKHNMDWWKGNEVEAYGSQIMVKTLYDLGQGLPRAGKAGERTDAHAYLRHFQDQGCR